MTFFKFPKPVLSLYVVIISMSVSGCSISPVPHYTGADGATIVFTMTTSSRLPPMLSLRRVNEENPIEIVYDNINDVVLPGVVADTESMRVGIVRHLPPGQYFLTGVGLGGAQGILHSYQHLKTPLPLTISAHEVVYLGSYDANLQVLPNTAQKTQRDLMEFALTDLSFEFSVSDRSDSDLKALAILKPELDASLIRNATPVIKN